MTDCNAESNWMVPKARKVAKKRNFPLVEDDEQNENVILLETSKTRD